MLKKALVLSVSLLAMNAFAETYSTEGKVYAGLKAGKFLVDVSGADDPLAYGFQVGYGLSNSVAAELSYLTGDGDLTDYGVGELDISSIAITAAFRTEGPLYLLAKVGLLHEKVKASGFGFYGYSSANESDTGLTLGLGGGYRVSKQFGLEAEYSIIESDVSFIGLSANVYF